MSEKDIEQQIKDAGLTAPRITPDHIESVIDGVVYFTAADGYRANPCYDPNSTPSSALPAPQSLELLTFCVITLKNGFTVTGESACASPENFNAEIGRQVAFENARNKIWMLEGYLLKQKLFEKNKPSTFQERVILEAQELKVKLDALSDFIVKGQPESIDDESWKLLNTQYKHMFNYHFTLLERIGNFA